MNRDNLQKMINHLETIDDSKFTMDIYRHTNHYSSIDMKTAECNTVGCVIGHCAVLDQKNVMKNFINPYGNIRFSSWSVSFTGLDYGTDKWDFLFSADWFKGDNTVRGAINRIKYLLEYGKPPKDYQLQMIGVADITYNKYYNNTN